MSIHFSIPLFSVRTHEEVAPIDTDSMPVARVRVTLGPNIGTLGGQPVIAIREIAAGLPTSCWRWLCFGIPGRSTVRYDTWQQCYNTIDSMISLYFIDFLGISGISIISCITSCHIANSFGHRLAQEIYSTQTDVTLNQPITSSDGSLSAFATDDSHMAAVRCLLWSELGLIAFYYN